MQIEIDGAIVRGSWPAVETKLWRHSVIKEEDVELRSLHVGHQLLRALGSSKWRLARREKAEIGITSRAGEAVSTFIA